MNANPPAVIAVGFFVAWIAILYAGADHPPPVGFLWLVAIVFSCAVVVYFRVPVYLDWLDSGGRGRTIRVFLEGVVAGMVIALATSLSRFTTEMIISQRTGDFLIWLVVLAILGGANSVAVYVVASLLARRSG